MWYDTEYDKIYDIIRYSVMNIKFKLLFKQLNEYRTAFNVYANSSDGYADIQMKILDEISKLTSQEAIEFIDELSDSRKNLSNFCIP